MKRWKTILGRSGTTLVAISLALFLVSIIPQSILSSSSGSMFYSPEQMTIVFNRYNLTPQQEVEVKVSVEGTLKIYLLEVNVEFQFVNGTFGYGFNLKDLQDFLEEHPDRVIWDFEVDNEEFERIYSPTRVINATAVIYNPGSENAIVEFEVGLTSSLAPGDKVQTIAYGISPVGIVLAIPWLLELGKQRKNK